MARKVVGVIGGTGLYRMGGLDNVQEIGLETPFGAPSDCYVRGSIGDVELVFLPRHGRGHRFLPTEVNYRANIFGMKKLGVEWIIAVSAVGSLQAEIAPGDVVVPDQFIDRTTQRPSTFFGRGVAAHVSMADPFCAALRKALAEAARAAGARVHDSGTYLCMEGPQFSTRAESRLYRSWGAHVIGMTNLQEAKLAREAEICYATLALASDYDCWNQAAGDVDIQQVIAILEKNSELAQRAIRAAVGRIPERRACPCASALKDAIVTDPKAIPADARRNLEILIGKYL
ncbi:MAG TPA: S-methyl-5'-thioadenosine phosphorylase [Candidatus Acidoferrales bacterium]|nr:S-methyl-5'-thioadenosine phosphorylase [Candidatus Acidoferrales bacterium]